jgi:hypothetical protein
MDDFYMQSEIRDGERRIRERQAIPGAGERGRPGVTLLTRLAHLPLWRLLARRQRSRPAARTSAEAHRSQLR